MLSSNCISLQLLSAFHARNCVKAKAWAPPKGDAAVVLVETSTVLKIIHIYREHKDASRLFTGITG